MTNPYADLYWISANWEQVAAASRYWVPMGAAGACFLVLIASIGWWHQRSLRLRFHSLVDAIGN